MAEDMFDNGSFLRRRKRYKRPSFPGHWSTMLDPYTRKLLSQYTFQHMHGNSSAGGHGGPPGHSSHTTHHQPPSHPPSSHMHPGLLPHPMLMPGSGSNPNLGTCSNGNISPPHQQHNNLPMSLNVPPQNHIMPPHPMIAAAARAAQLVNFPIRPPPPPCSVGFPPSTLTLNTSSSAMKSPRRPSPENSPTLPSELSSPNLNSPFSSPFPSCLTSSKPAEFTSNVITASNIPMTKSTMRSSRGSGFTIDNIIGDQRKGDSSNNNNTVVRGENYVEEKEDENTSEVGNSFPKTKVEENSSVEGYNNDFNIQNTEVVKTEKEDENTNNNANEVNEDTNFDSLKQPGDDQTLKHPLHHQGSNLPSFLHCAMLGKIVANTKSELFTESCEENMEKQQKSAISPILLQPPHYQTTDSWK